MRFTRLRGTKKVGEYQVNCNSRQTAPCIERDEILVADGSRSGPHEITVKSLVGPTICSLETDVLTIPEGSSLAKLIQLPPSDAPSC